MAYFNSQPAPSQPRWQHFHKGTGRNTDNAACSDWIRPFWVKQPDYSNSNKWIASCRKKPFFMGRLTDGLPQTTTSPLRALMVAFSEDTSRKIHDGTYPESIWPDLILLQYWKVSSIVYQPWISKATWCLTCRQLRYNHWPKLHSRIVPLFPRFQTSICSLDMSPICSHSLSEVYAAMQDQRTEMTTNPKRRNLS